MEEFMEMNREEISQREENLRRFEYDKCFETFKHYDTLNWQIGGILVAGLMIFSGQIIAKVMEDGAINPCVYNWLPFVGLLNYTVMIIWIKFFLRHRELYNSRINRMREIEDILNINNFRIAAKEMYPEKLEYWRLSGFQWAILLATIFPWAFFILYWYLKRDFISVIFLIITFIITCGFNMYGILIKKKTHKEINK
jgi:hypothetical protein